MIDPRLPAKERSKLMTYGDGLPPYVGYVWDEENLFWHPGEGVVDVHAKAAEDWLVPQIDLKPGAVNYRNGSPLVQETATPAKVHLVLKLDGLIISAYFDEARAQRDIDLVKKAGGVALELKTMDIEA